MEKEVALGDVLVDCKDSAQLCNFYAELLGWEKFTLYGAPAVRSKNGITFLFMAEDDYVPPVWPEETGRQQKQMHFDFLVPDVSAAVRKAESLGAVTAKDQFGGEKWTTMLDPAGHPLCLCAAD